MKMMRKRHIASWLLLAVFLPMLVFYGHLTQTASWAHDCVLCQFLTLTMLTAALMAVTVYIHVCKKHHVQPSIGYHTTCCGMIVTRGPPSV